VAGVDFFVAEPRLIRKGLGTAILCAFARDVVFADGTTTACVADPEATNAVSIRASEKAGFRRVREFVEPEERTTHVLMRMERAQGPDDRGLFTG
jgi:RimJ/RimL family protein N-acetyltransferase